MVTHDTRRHALACLAGLDEAGADEVVLVDSGSTDGTAAAVRRAHPGVAVVELPNVGYARAANAGIVRTRAPFVAVANADVRFRPGTLRTLAATLAADPALAGVGPLVRYPDGTPQASARRLPDPATAVGHALLGLWWPSNPWTRRYRMRDVPAGEPREVDWLSGCALLLRRRALAVVDGFDPGYFLFVEDLDLGWRLRRAGWRLRFEPTAEVVHHVGAATDAGGWRTVLAHARSLDRFYGRAYATGPGRWLRPLVRLALAAWALVAAGWQRLARDRAGRSRTGEPRGGS